MPELTCKVIKALIVADQCRAYVRVAPPPDMGDATSVATERLDRRATHYRAPVITLALAEDMA